MFIDIAMLIKCDEPKSLSGSTVLKIPLNTQIPIALHYEYWLMILDLTSGYHTEIYSIVY